MQGLTILNDILEKVPEALNINDIRSRVTDFTPYVVVAIQVWCQRGFDFEIESVARACL
jgi:hypothetical protein